MSDTQSKRGSIALIDDEPGVLLALRLVLQTLNFEVHPFSDPADAILRIRDKSLSPTIIVCDLRMPKLSGLAVLRELRMQGSETPFLLISAHATDSERDEAFVRGANGFLTKPFTPQDFVRKFEEVTSGSPQQSSCHPGPLASNTGMRQSHPR